MAIHRGDVLAPVELDWIAAGPGFPFAESPVSVAMRRCVPCNIETAEDTCFGCGAQTESFGARAAVAYFEH